MDPAEFEQDIGRFKHHLKRTIVTGFLVLIPATVTIWVLLLVFNTVDAWLGNLLAMATGIRIPGLGLLLTLLLVYGMGLFASNVVGRRMIGSVEGFMDRLPLIRGVYRVSKEVSTAFGKKEKRPFRKVVAIEFPRRGVWTLGFLTAEVPEQSPAPDGSVYVFVPTTPNPTSGWLLMVPEEDVLSTPYSIDEGMRIIISAGIVGPHHLQEGEEDTETRSIIVSSPERGHDENGPQTLS